MELTTKRMTLRGEKGALCWALVLSETGEECGRCAMEKSEWQGEPIWRISWELKKQFLHLGYAAEAVRACKDYAFTELGLTQVYAMVLDTDQPGIAAAMRSGMRLRGRKDAFETQATYLVFSVKKND